jgi:hypothetical protein
VYPYKYETIKVLRVVNIKIRIFCIMMPCHFIDGIAGTCFLHLYVRNTELDKGE